MSGDPINPLITIFEEEKRALLSGNYAAIDALAERKGEALAAALANRELLHLERLNKALQENTNLLGAALMGMRAARARLCEMKNVRDELTVYLPSGSLTSADLTRSKIIKKI